MLFFFQIENKPFTIRIAGIYIESLFWIRQGTSCRQRCVLICFYLTQIPHFFIFIVLKT